MRILSTLAVGFSLLLGLGNALAAPIDLEARGLLLGDTLFTDAVTVEYEAGGDFFQATNLDFSAVVDGNPLATNAFVQIAPNGLDVEFDGSAVEVGSMPSFVELLVEADTATGAFASIATFALVRLDGTPALDLGGDIVGLSATLTVSEVSPIPLPLTAPLLLGGLAALWLRGVRREG